MKVEAPWALIVGLLGGITLLHLTVGTESVVFHNVFRRLYYLPIILAAFQAGRLGGGLAALGAAALYFPHAFLMHHHLDPAPAGDKILEMVLYGVVGLVTGLLVERGWRAAAEARAAEERARRLEALVRLTSGLAHEIRNPLAAIQGSFEILADDYAEGSEKREIIDVGVTQTARLDRVLTDFVAFARPRDPKREALDLVALVERVRGSASLTRPDVTVRCSAPDTPVKVLADPDQLEQCVLNLALNAIQWSPSDAEVLLLVRSGARPGVVVEDAGPGVAEADRARIFDPYFTRRAGGGGLGLAISARIAESNAATLTYAAREEGGARFTLAFRGPA